MQIKIKRIGNGKLPVYKTEGSAGADCYAHIEKQIILKAGNRITIPLGFAVEIPEGYEMQIRGRSGIANRNGVDNFIGTIDSDYRGEVRAILINKSIKDFIIEPGDRIAQAVVAPVIKAEWNEVEKLSDTERGAGGFGSTGVKSEEIKMSYNSPVAKFYEPFKSADAVEEYIGKTVIIYGDEYKVQKVEVNKTSFGKCIVIYFYNEKERKTVNMYATQAFQYVKINNHAFGQEMEYEEKID